MDETYYNLVAGDLDITMDSLDLSADDPIFKDELGQSRRSDVNVPDTEQAPEQPTGHGDRYVKEQMREEARAPPGTATTHATRAPPDTTTD